MSVSLGLSLSGHTPETICLQNRCVTVSYPVSSGERERERERESSNHFRAKALNKEGTRTRCNRDGFMECLAREKKKNS